MALRKFYLITTDYRGHPFKLAARLTRVAEGATDYRGHPLKLAARLTRVAEGGPAGDLSIADVSSRECKYTPSRSLPTKPPQVQVV